MAAISITLNKITVRNGKHFLDFGKIQMEFNNLAEARQFANSPLDRMMFIALFMKTVFDRDPNLSNIAAIEGRTLTIDTANNVSPPWGKIT